MTTVLYWNIENFGINKVNHPSMALAPPGHGGLTHNAASVRRRQLILRHVAELQPDIIVVVEVCTGAPATHLITNTGGLQGCAFLLNYLRITHPFSTQDWRLVPPLVVGEDPVQESVAVFFRGTTGGITRFFTGPNQFSAPGFSIAPGAGVAADYPMGPVNFRSMLAPGPGRVVPANALHNHGMAETQLAARHSFNITVPPGPLGGWVDFLHYRQPLMATFTEIGGVLNPRHITIFACHAPPRDLPPTHATTNFMLNLSDMADIANPPDANETKLICGDFNLNLLNRDGSDAGMYNWLTTLGYQLLLPPPAGPPAPADLAAYQGYFSTHIRRPPSGAGSRFLWSLAHQPSPYPGYGYTGSNFGPQYRSIDNVLVRSGAGVGVPTFMVVNSVVGAPMNAVVPVPGGAPPGVGPAAFNHDMLGLVGHFWPEVPNANDWNIGMATHRKSWDNYGHIRNTSDHFGLLATV